MKPHTTFFMHLSCTYADFPFCGYEHGLFIAGSGQDN